MPSQISEVENMQVTQMADGALGKELPKLINQDMQNEYNYLLSEQLTQRLFSAGLITAEEQMKIMEKNRQSFSPIISKIIP